MKKQSKTPDWKQDPRCGKVRPRNYQSNDPEGLASDVRYFRKYMFTPEAGYVPKELRQATDAALRIRASYPELPPVPLASNPDWPTEQDFIRIEQYFVTAAMASDGNNSNTHLGPTEKDILALIGGFEELKQAVEDLHKKSFLTSVQREATEQSTEVETALYLLKLEVEDEEKCWEHIGIIKNYFLPTGSVDHGRFVEAGNGRIEWYNPERHEPLAVRCEFDDNAFRDFLRAYTAKKRQEYRDKHIKPRAIVKCCG